MVDTLNLQTSYGEQKLDTIESCCCCSISTCLQSKGLKREYLKQEGLRNQKSDQLRLKAKSRAARELKEKQKAKEKNMRFSTPTSAPPSSHSSSGW
jgi:hypothetical protein